MVSDFEPARLSTIPQWSTINTRDCQKCYTKSCQKCDKSITAIKSIAEIKSTTEMTNNTVYTDKYTVNEHMVNMVASRKATKNMDNAISSEPTTSKDDMENKQR
jgi:hypothetical protein